FSFFFQAEDGIRDFHVTGVQTCALPISGLRRPEYLGLLAWTLFASWLALVPERWRQRHPERVAGLERRWWGRALLPRRSDWWMRSEERRVGKECRWGWSGKQEQKYTGDK